MTDKPILYSAPMIRALLDGRKTQTRRIIKLSGRLPDFCGGRCAKDDPACWGWEDCDNGNWVTLEKEPGQRLGWRDLTQAYRPGDRLWVREVWSGEHWLADVKPSERLLMGNPSRLVSMIPETWYWADGSPDHGDWERPRPSIHMPRWASRLTLTVTDVRVQRLQEVSESDAKAEGVMDSDPLDTPFDAGQEPKRQLFADLWNSINGPDAWDANPWVVALTFDVHHCNIDQMDAAE